MFKHRGRGVRRQPGTMNKTEARYAEVLSQRCAAGEIALFLYEGITLKLAKDTRYTPDFFVMLADGTIEFHEVKGGFFEDHSKVKLKVAASLFPFVFRLVRARPQRDGGGFVEEEVGV